MQQVALGKTPLTIVPLVFGGNVFGWSVDKQQSFKLLDAFVDAGLNMIDTADCYSIWADGHQGGESETILGKWFKQSGKRNKVILATKVGMKMADGSQGLSAAHITKSVENSLKRLQTDVIDLYQAHIDDPNTSFEETFSAFDKLIKAGKVRFIGASNYSADRLEAAITASQKLNLAVFQTLQPEYNLYDRQGYETKLQATVKKLGLGVITYYSLASGFLSGKYKTTADLQKSAARSPKVKEYLNDRGLKILATLNQVASDYNATPAQVALAWLRANPTVTAPIVSSTTVEQLTQLIKGLTLTLTQDTVAALNQASSY